jgi:Radical SAM superfamily
MRVGIVSVFVDYHRRGRKNRLSIQPQAGALIAGLISADPNIAIEVINDAWRDPDWSRDYDLLLISCLHSDFDRARQLSHYWRQRGAKTVLGGPLASRFPGLCQPYFDAVVVGDAESTVPRIITDFKNKALQPQYLARAYDPRDVPVPRFDLAYRQQVVPISFEATRGCPFTCDFCSLTSLGTRFHTRPVASVVRDIREGQRQLAGRLPRFMLNFVAFTDNNIGGRPGYLRELCAALQPLKIHWTASVTFNIASNPELVRLMAQSGCYTLFVGLESFNPAALADMHKPQNVVAKTRDMIRLCRQHGINVMAGLMLSPTADDQAYLDAIPAFLAHSELRVPAFISLETPFPGTPYFERLASMPNALLPNALLRDFSGYTLVVKPQKLPGNALLDGYRQLLDRVYTLPARVKKVATDAPRLLARGGWDAALLGSITTLGDNYHTDPGRTYVAGTDRAPSEQVPFSDGDFTSHQQRAAIVDPWMVTDQRSRVLPQWLSSGPLYGKRGAIMTRTPAAADARVSRQEPVTPPLRLDPIPVRRAQPTTPERMPA